MLLFLPAVLNGPAPLQQLALNYDKALIRHPVVTRTATGAALAAAGDAVAQFREQRQLRQQRPALGDYNGVVKPTAAISRPYDVRRAAALVLVEGFYRGILQQLIIAWIISAFTGDGLRRLGLGRLFGTELCALLERVSFNQFVIAPNVYYSMFFITTGAFQGLSWGQIVKRWRSQLPRLVGLNSLYWFPVQVCATHSPSPPPAAHHKTAPPLLASWCAAPAVCRRAAALQGAVHLRGRAGVECHSLAPCRLRLEGGRKPDAPPARSSRARAARSRRGRRRVGMHRVASCFGPRVVVSWSARRFPAA